jgi:FlaA1/EpsC-like NDP-sugar epimerase
MAGLHEALRLIAINALGTGIFVVLLFFFARLTMLPRSVIVLEFFLSTAVMAAYRFYPRIHNRWHVNRARAHNHSTQRTLIVGAGNAGDILLRDLERSEAHSYHIVGFVDDDVRKQGASIGGKPVLGGIARLPEIIARHKISKVLIAIPRLPASRVREILSLCSQSNVAFKIIPASFTTLNKKITAAMLHELSPEDLLPRDPISFDPMEIRSVIQGKHVLVTGAGGSIGSEIARQVASHLPKRLVLVDMNENELYFLLLRLRELHPTVDIRAAVADIRDFGRLKQLGTEYKPNYVFHAAAHKHVPLMEDAPGEAIKNNVFGTLNVARMADVCGANNFVLISTDKAVRPSSVMGASKRVAELAVRDLARKSRTRFTAVRFGNVLGSAGSVVPLFKQQIQRGGPVTVTHPDCRRYFMTIPEAVGLVLLAGLGNHGDLCLLDMGEPIKIVDLASNMITMAGMVPGKDIPISFVGLRPGEKMTEELLTEEEEDTRQVRNRIMVAISPAPPSDLASKLVSLEQAALFGDRDAIMAELKSIVPSFRSTGGGVSKTLRVAASTSEPILVNEPVSVPSLVPVAPRLNGPLAS